MTTEPVGAPLEPATGGVRAADEPSRSERPPLWAFLPCAILAAVALWQIVTALTGDLTAWKGGGFGMFATTDTGGNRQVRAYAVFDDRERRLTLPQRDRLRRTILNFPTEARVGAYANALAARMERRQDDLRELRVELWRASFDPETRTYRSQLWHDYVLELRRAGRQTGAHE